MSHSLKVGHSRVILLLFQHERWVCHPGSFPYLEITLWSVKRGGLFIFWKVTVPTIRKGERISCIWTRYLSLLLRFFFYFPSLSLLASPYVCAKPFFSGLWVLYYLCYHWHSIFTCNFPSSIHVPWHRTRSTPRDKTSSGTQSAWSVLSECSSIPACIDPLRAVPTNSQGDSRKYLFPQVCEIFTYIMPVYLSYFHQIWTYTRLICSHTIPCITVYRPWIFFSVQEPVFLNTVPHVLLCFLKDSVENPFSLLISR